MVGGDSVGAVGARFARPDAGGAVPGQELGIAFDIGNQVEHLPGAVGKVAGILMVGQWYLAGFGLVTRPGF